MKVLNIFQINKRFITTLRKDLLPFIKLIHPDLFIQQNLQIKKENLKFLQSLNELSDNIQNYSLKLKQKESIEINQPLSKTYIFSFYIKEGIQMNENNQNIQNNENINFKKMKLVITTPHSLCNRTKLTKSSYNRSISSLLKQLGGLFEAVNLTNPWKTENSSDGYGNDDDDNINNNNNNEDEEYDPLKKQNQESQYEQQQKESGSSDHKHWKEQNFARRSHIDPNDKQMQLLIKELTQLRRLEKEVVWKWNTHPSELMKIIQTFHYILPQKQQQQQQQRVPYHEINSNFYNEMYLNTNRIASKIYQNSPSNSKSSSYYSPISPISSTTYRSDERYTERQIQLMVEINRFVLNGHIYTQSIPSKDDEVAILNSLRVFFFEFGNIINFSYKQWNEVIFIASGNISKKDVKEMKKVQSNKKLSKYERELQLYSKEIIESNSTSVNSNDEEIEESKSQHTIITIPYDFTPKVLCSYITHNIPQSNTIFKSFVGFNDTLS